MAKITVSAGLLVYRYNKGVREYLLVHPSGDYNIHQPYYIPKGQLEERESEEEAAKRETYEETGVVADVVFDLGYITYKSKKKKVRAFLAKYVRGKVLKDGSVDWPDWENNIKIFVDVKRAKRLLKKEMIIFIGMAEAYLSSKNGEY
jgi:predicted NUDIX family NTP pyrophosphohydrolase